MSLPIDCVVVVTTDANIDWKQELLASLQLAGVNTVQVDMLQRGLGASMAEGLRKGSNPYVSYVAEYDDVEPSVFAECISALESNPKAVACFTREIELGIHGKAMGTPYSLDGAEREPSPVYISGLMVARRDLVISKLPYMENYNKGAEWALVRSLRSSIIGGLILEVPTIGKYSRRLLLKK